MRRRFAIPAPSKAEPGPSLLRRVHLRDGRACVYCGASESALVIDHVRARAHYPSTAAPSAVNDPRNLVTACEECNGSKGPQNLDGFATMLRGRGVSARAVASMRRRVRAATRRPLSVYPPP